MLRFLIAFFVFISVCVAQSPTYVVLWFDTEDYVDPIADDAALRIATDLTKAGVRATFKIVGEKGRVLESRGRRDVIEALGRHSIGYHSNWHSIQPVPALDLEHLGWQEGADEFYRRQIDGYRDLSRIFSIAPVCYGQPGSSWAPQSNAALRRMGVHIYLDEGSQVGLKHQPFWYDGLLYVFNMGPNLIRADVDGKVKIEDTFKTFDAAVQQLSKAGGGLISTYYHPTEFVHTEFWDAANFNAGATRPRDQWVNPKRRTPEDAEHCYRALHDYVEHAKSTPGVRFITADDLLHIYSTPLPPVVNVKTLAQHFTDGINYLSMPAGDLSAADVLLQMLNLPYTYVDGPTFRGQTNYEDATIPEALFKLSIDDVKAFIEMHHRLPSQVFVGSRTLSLGDFAATLAKHVLEPGPVTLVHGKLTFEQYFSTDAAGSFKWPIHPPGFAPKELLELGRLQGWTLKPARLR
jgi:hypothetical protein